MYFFNYALYMEILALGGAHRLTALEYKELVDYLADNGMVLPQSWSFHLLDEKVF